MKLTRTELRALLEFLEATRDDEIDCDEFLAAVPGLLEGLGEGRPPSALDAVLHHLEVCPECLEEFEALRDLLGRA